MLLRWGEVGVECLRFYFSERRYSRRVLSKEQINKNPFPLSCGFRTHEERLQLRI